MPKFLKKANQKGYIIKRIIATDGCLKIIRFTCFHYQLSPLSRPKNSRASKSRFKIKPLTLPAQCISESCIKIKINMNFYFHTTLWGLKRFYEGL